MKAVGLAAFCCIALVGAASLPAEDQPRLFVVDGQARPIEADEASGPLRWRAATPPSIAATGGRGSSAPTAATSGRGSLQPVSAASFDSASEHVAASRPGWNITRVDPSVRPAQAISDPFRDPFGDKQAGYDEPLLLAPTQAEANVEELPPPRSISAPRLNAPDNQFRPVNQFNTVNQNTVQQPGSPRLDPGQEVPRFDQREGPGERVYNDRNCTAVEQDCREFRNRLLSDSIRNISLDITPRYYPDLTPEEDAAERAERLRLLESRAWRDRRGTVVATGRMADLVNNAVVIVDDAGRETGRVSLHQLGEDELCYVTAWWRLPAECALGGLEIARRDWIPSTYAWHASALCHKPLYFEQPQLERYGHTTGPWTQPVVSGAHFFLNIATLPYQMAINPPHECQYALGYYRPGSCAPKMIRPIPLSLRGAAAQTGAVLGGVFLIP